MNDPLDFTGKVVLVTGSSRGLGAEMIKAFGNARRAMRRELCRRPAGRKQSGCLGVAKELNEPLVIECDVTQPEQVEAMMKQIAGKIRRPRYPGQQLRGYPRPHD